MQFESHEDVGMVLPMKTGLVSRRAGFGEILLKRPEHLAMSVFSVAL